MCAPCRHYPPLWNARDLDAVDAGLSSLRHDLLAGTLAPCCMACPDMPPGTPDALRALLSAAGLTDGNLRTAAIRAALASTTPLPPPDLMFRVTHSHSGYDFVASGVVNLSEILPHLLPHLPEARPHLLDFGCGCGRLARHLLQDERFGAYTGCDIDDEAVRWCRAGLSGGQFVTIAPEAPTEFGDGSFAAIICYSVMTHLARDHQAFWLSELHRIMAPGGILAVTIHAETAAERNGLTGRLAREGMIDDIPDNTLHGVAPPGYYRSTFQSAAQFKQMNSRWFEQVDHIRGAMMGYQDLMILRRKADEMEEQRAKPEAT